MPAYLVKSEIHHDNQAFAEGSTIQLGEKQAARLLELGHIEPAKVVLTKDSFKDDGKGTTEDKTKKGKK